MSVKQTEVTGLLGSVGKAIASQPRSDRCRERLKEVNSPDTFRDYLERSDLGIAPRAKREFIDAVTGDDWRDYHARLLQSADISYHERMAPSS